MTTIREQVTWIDLVSPSRKELEFLHTDFGVHPIILDELLEESGRARVESRDGYLFMVYQLPVYNGERKTSQRAEVDFIITTDTVITVRHRDLEPLDALAGMLEANHRKRTEVVGKDTIMLTYHLVESLIEFQMRQLRHIEANVERVSSEIFRGRERELLEHISRVKRDLLDYHLISRPQAITLASLARAGATFWGARAGIYLEDLAGDNRKIQYHLEGYIQVIESLEETNAQLLNARINFSMQTFTILAFFTFPLVLFTSIYALNNVGTDFWIGFGAIALITLVLPFILRQRNIF